MKAELCLTFFISPTLLKTPWKQPQLLIKGLKVRHLCLCFEKWRRAHSLLPKYSRSWGHLVM